MSPELVRPNLEVWVHSHYRMPQRGTLTTGHIMTSKEKPYSWLTVNINGHCSDYEIGRITIYGNNHDLAYYYHNGKKLFYEHQAAHLVPGIMYDCV